MRYTSESDDEFYGTLLTWKSKLQSWAVEGGVSWALLDKLLPILKEVDSSLLLTAKTFLKTGATSINQPRQLSGGDYIHFGVRTGLTVVLADRTELDNLTVLELALNVDGVPLYHSSTFSLWPVLCYVMNVKPHKVFVISLFGGKSKPSDLHFLDEAVKELNTLLAEGMLINGKLFQCIVKFCVCDAPARAMVRCTKLFFRILRL